jgi:hypothetical protein
MEETQTPKIMVLLSLVLHFKVRNVFGRRPKKESHHRKCSTPKSTESYIGNTDSGDDTFF